jgi:hypothetical protein
MMLIILHNSHPTHPAQLIAPAAFSLLRSGRAKSRTMFESTAVENVVSTILLRWLSIVPPFTG